jgi:hypothetical protein
MWRQDAGSFDGACNENRSLLMPSLPGSHHEPLVTDGHTKPCAPAAAMVHAPSGDMMSSIMGVQSMHENVQSASVQPNSAATRRNSSTW